MGLILIKIYLSTNSNLTNYYDKFYGFNPQNCQLRKKSSEEDCCYLSVYIKEDWYNFCGKVLKNFQIEKGQSFASSFYQHNLTNSTNDTIKSIFENSEKYFKLDCLSRKIKIIKSFCFLALMLLV